MWIINPWHSFWVAIGIFLIILIYACVDIYVSKDNKGARGIMKTWIIAMILGWLVLSIAFYPALHYWGVLPAFLLVIILRLSILWICF